MTTTNSLNINTSGLPIFDSATGDFTSVQATALGDLIVHNGTNYTRLPVGVDGEALIADSGESTGFSWDNVPFTGNMVLLQTVTASSSATVSFTDLDTTTYASFFFFLDQVHPQTDNVSLRTLFSINNGSSYLGSNYRWIYRILESISVTASENHSSSSSVIQAAETIGNAGTEGIAGWFWYFPSNNPSQMRQSIQWQLYSNDTSSDLVGYFGSGINTTTSAVDAIRFQFSSGNIESGIFYLYGLTAS